MQIITTTPALWPQPGRLGFLGLKWPKPKLRRSLASFFVTISDAFQLAYVAPYERRHRQVEQSNARPDHRI